MAVIQTTQATQQTTQTAPATSQNYNWATIQLNLIMLPVGLSLLLIVSLTAIFCHCLRKKRLKRMAKELKRQQKLKKEYSAPANGASKFTTFSHSPVRSNSSGVYRQESLSPMHPATFRKEKKRKMPMSQSQNHDTSSLSSEKKRKTPRRSVTPSSERPRSKDINRNGKVPQERRVSGIPVPIKSKKKGRRKNSVENGKIHYTHRYSSFDKEIAIIDRDDPYTIDMDTVRSSRDRRKWDIPATPSIEYDSKGGLRLPPLLELRTAKTA